MITNGVEYNFNRMLRVTLSDNSGEIVIEYCPLADERLNPKMDVTIKCMPVIVNKNDKPGFSAKIVIYNPPPSVLAMINKHITWPIGNKTQKEYYSARCRVSVDAGYYNPNSANPRGNYSRIGALGDWWLNSSAYYRKGVDNILELWCHELQLETKDIQKMTSAAKAMKVGYQRTVVQNIKERGIAGNDQTTWDMVLELLIRQFAPQKAPLFNTVIPSSSLGMSVITTVPTEEQRKGKEKFFLIQYIQQPSDESEPRNGAKPDHELEIMAQQVWTRGLVLNGTTFQDKLIELINYFPVPIVVREDLNYTDGITRYWVWRPRRSDGSLSAADSGPVIDNKTDSNVVTIYNFQNMLEVPSVDGSGCFTAKMLFNPNVRPNRFLKLSWVDDLRSGQAVSSYTKGVATSASYAQYYPSLQGGVYQAQVYARTYEDRKNADGYLFEEYYRIGYVTHHLSTHTNNWYTEVRTLSILAGR